MSIWQWQQLILLGLGLAVAATQPLCGQTGDTAAARAANVEVGQESLDAAVPSADLSQDVARWVQQLQSTEKGDRDAAEAELVKLGSPVLGLLPQVTVDTSEEMRARLNRIRKQLQRAAAEAAVQGSRVTLEGEMRLSDALARLEKQTENRLIDFRGQFNQPRLDPKINVAFEQVAYWTALENIFEQAGLQLYAYTNEPNTLGFIARSDKLTVAAQAAATELFRMQVIRLQAIRDLRDDDNQGLVVTMEVTWEPRLTPITIKQPLEELRATGDDGSEIKTMQGRGITEMSVQTGISSVELELPFALPERKIQRISSLKGTLTAMVPGGKMKLEFHDLANAREVTQGESGINVVLLQTRKNRALYELRVLLRIGGSDEQLRSQRGWVYSNEAYLLDKDGRRVEYAGLESFRETLTEVGLSYKFDVPGGLDGYRFVYESPAAVMTVPVEYEIKDIVLP